MNTFWLYAVLLHIVGSIVFSLTGLFPMGGLLCLTVLWGLFLYLSDRNIKNVCVILFGWLLSGILMFTMPISYGSSLLMNLLMLLLVWYVCRQRQTGLWEFSSLRWIPVRQWGIILLLSILLFLVASYVNALPVFKRGRTFYIEVINPVHYASYVEFGHRTRGGGGWVAGQYFLTLSERDLERVAPAVIEKKLEALLREAFNV